MISIKAVFTVIDNYTKICDIIHKYV